MGRRGWIGTGADDGHSRGRRLLLSAGIMTRRDTHAARRRIVAGSVVSGPGTTPPVGDRVVDGSGNAVIDGSSNQVVP